MTCGVTPASCLLMGGNFCVRLHGLLALLSLGKICHCLKSKQMEAHHALFWKNLYLLVIKLEVHVNPGLV